MQELTVLIGGTGVLIALAIAVISLFYARQTRAKYERMLGGLDEKGDLLETLESYFTGVKSVESKLDTIQKNYRHLSGIATASIQKTAIFRFNPFKNTGSDQSFVLALLDNHDNGLLLTSIHSREGTRVYIKPIKYGSSEHTLSKEEKSALTAAQGSNEEARD